MEFTQEALASLLHRASEAAAKPITAPNLAVPLVALQSGYSVASLENYLENPARIKASPAFSSAQSFIDYVERFGDPNATVIFVSGQSFRAAIDYHQPGMAGDPPLASWVAHTATFEPIRTNAWAKWLQNNDKAMGQTEFALFLEQRLQEIVDPTAAEVMTSVLKFREYADMTLQSDQNLGTGEVEFRFVKQNKNASTSFPTQMAIKLPIFENHPPIMLEMYVRYRQKEGVLSMWYVFKRDPVDIMADYFRAHALEPMRADLAQFTILEGKA